MENESFAVPFDSQPNDGMLRNERDDRGDDEDDTLPETNFWSYLVSWSLILKLNSAHLERDFSAYGSSLHIWNWGGLSIGHFLLCLDVDPWGNCVNVRVIGCLIFWLLLMRRMRHRQVVHENFIEFAGWNWYIINMALWEDETASMSVILSSCILGCLRLKDQKIEETNETTILVCCYRFCIFCGVCIEADRSPCLLLLERGAKFGVLFPTSPEAYVVYIMYAHHTDPWREIVKAELLVVVVVVSSA